MAPDGSLLHISVNLLNGSIFKDYFYPGLILLIANGIIPIAVAVLGIKENSFFPLLLVTQGVMLVIWITVEALTIKEIQFLQLIYNFIGIFFIVAGITLFEKMKDLNAGQE